MFFTFLPFENVALFKACMLVCLILGGSDFSKCNKFVCFGSGRVAICSVKIIEVYSNTKITGSFILNIRKNPVIRVGGKKILEDEVEKKSFRQHKYH